MRMLSLVMQGLVAGAILFLPSVAFADKGETGPSEREKSVAAKQNDHAAKKTEVQKPAVKKSNKAAHHQVPAKRPVVNKGRERKTIIAPAKRRVTHPSNAKRKIHQPPKHVQSKPKTVIGHHPVHKKSVASKQQKPVKNVLALNGKSAVTHKIKQNVTRDQIKPVPAQKKTPVREPVKSPSVPSNKAVLVQSLQTINSASKDKENSGKSPSLIKGLIVSAETSDVHEPMPSFCSRLDLLRNQWVNAPPSEPPKRFLNFSDACK